MSMLPARLQLRLAVQAGTARRLVENASRWLASAGGLGPAQPATGAEQGAYQLHRDAHGAELQLASAAAGHGTREHPDGCHDAGARCDRPVTAVPRQLARPDVGVSEQLAPWHRSRPRTGTRVLRRS